MNIGDLNLEIDNSKLNINLKLYSLLKEVVKIKFTESESNTLIENLILTIESNISFDDSLECFLTSIESENLGVTKKNKLKELLNDSLINTDDFTIFKLALHLNRYKKLVLEESKLIADAYSLSNNVHIMSYSYDYGSLNKPYAVRVAGALLLNLLFDGINSTNVLLSPIREDLEKVPMLDANVIIQIIYAESASQSLRSSAGSSYEGRFKKYIDSKAITNAGQSHDSNIQAVEYDFVLTTTTGNKVGVSVKRTLRERYKQNHEEVDSLDVDAMLLVTLGIDLNEAKVAYITAKEKYYIFVADDIFAKKPFLNRANKVYPVTDLDNELLTELSE